MIALMQSNTSVTPTGITPTNPTSVIVVGGQTTDNNALPQPIPLTSSGQAIQTIIVSSPKVLLSPFKCNALRKTNCN